MSMQFWGLEVKSKEAGKVSVEEGQVIHISQATLGDLKKASEPVTINVLVNGKKFVLGILSQSTPQLSFDLVFDTEFEISHNFKNGTVHFLGYQTEFPIEGDEYTDDSSDEDVPVLQRENGKADEIAKPKAAAVPVKDSPKQEDTSDSSGDDSSDEEDVMGSSDDEDMIDEDDDDEDDDESEDEKPVEEVKPVKAESGKKRPNADAKTPESKKAKIVTPQKTDGKKGAQPHTATPHPSKKGGKTPGGDKSATPKSAVSCEACKKSFNSDIALQSHNKAKHSAAK